MKTIKTKEEETNTEGGQEEFLNENEDLDYLKSTFEDMKIKELEYVSSLLSSILSEKRARFRMLNNKKNNGAPTPVPSSSYEQENDDDFI